MSPVGKTPYSRLWEFLLLGLDLFLRIWYIKITRPSYCEK